MDEEVLEKWYKRIEKKGPYYLFDTKPQTRDWMVERYPGCQRYWLIWQETIKGKVKTKLAVAEDGMSARYGFSSWAVLTGKSVTGLWQHSSGLISEEQLAALLDVANGKINLPLFDIRSLTNVEW